jgi:uncharacterized alpha-E superfamily protein
MLCRVADSLFWMSRYIERAENTARLTDVHVQLLLELSSGDGEMTAAHWRAVLASLGDLAPFEESGAPCDTPSVTQFLTFSADNPSSVLSCVLAARENARMIRDQISVEMWEVINRLYLFLRKQDAGRVLRAGPSDFFQVIKEMSHLFRGLTDALFPRKVGYEFIRAGCYLERADKTARILDVTHHMGEGAGARVAAGLDAPTVVLWVSALRSCTALEAYHRVFVGEVLPRNVIDLLVLSRDFPRSLLFCLNQLQLSLHAISGCPVSHYSNEAERMVGKVISEIAYSSVESILRDGLHDLVVRVKGAVNGIALELGHLYMLYPIIDPTGEDAPAAVEDEDEDEDDEDRGAPVAGAGSQSQGQGTAN